MNDSIYVISKFGALQDKYSEMSSDFGSAPLSEYKLERLRHRNQPSTSSLGEVSDRGGHPASSPEARQQADDQRPDFGLRGLQRTGVGE